MAKTIYDFMIENPMTTLFLGWSISDTIVKFTKILFNKNIVELEDKIQILENKVNKMEKLSYFYHDKNV